MRGLLGFRLKDRDARCARWRRFRHVAIAAVALTATVSDRSHFLGSSRAGAEELARHVTSPEEFERAIAAARPGDTITIANGRYDGWRLEVPATINGKDRRPITVRGESPAESRSPELHTSSFAAATSKPPI